jgi:hypothetical protein
VELRGSSVALAAFDIGFSILHELAHGVWYLHDDIDDQRQIGSCEERINQMRRELELPERQSYIANLLPIRRPENTFLRAELLFVLVRYESGQSRIRRFYLQWDADKVAGRDRSSLQRRDSSAAPR